MNQSELNEEEAVSQTGAATPSPKRKSKKGLIVAGVVAAIVVVAGAGFWVWHEQPSFCNAICHTPMDPYNATYDQEPGVAGTDKWGNGVTNTSSMLAVSHKQATEEGGAGATCMSCHIPSLDEQISEGLNWVSGNYVYPLQERSLEDLVAARGVDEEAFCLNEACHANEDGSAMTRDDLIETTSNYALNPHVEEHKEVSCGECHKAHRASVMYCTECHDEAVVPEGWVTAAESSKMLKAYAE